MKQKERKALNSSLNKILKSRSSKDIWSLYNKMSGNVKESDKFKLKTEEIETI
jgi:hypothetical protein